MLKRAAAFVVLALLISVASLTDVHAEARSPKIFGFQSDSHLAWIKDAEENNANGVLRGDIIQDGPDSFAFGESGLISHQSMCK